MRSFSRITPDGFVVAIDEGEKGIPLVPPETVEHITHVSQPAVGMVQLDRLNEFQLSENHVLIGTRITPVLAVEHRDFLVFLAQLVHKSGWPLDEIALDVVASDALACIELRIGPPLLRQ